MIRFLVKIRRARRRRALRAFAERVREGRRLKRVGRFGVQRAQRVLWPRTAEQAARVDIVDDRVCAPFTLYVEVYVKANGRHVAVLTLGILPGKKELNALLQAFLSAVERGDYEFESGSEGGTPGVMPSGSGSNGNNPSEDSKESSEGQKGGGNSGGGSPSESEHSENEGSESEKSGEKGAGGGDAPSGGSDSSGEGASGGPGQPAGENEGPSAERSAAPGNGGDPDTAAADGGMPSAAENGSGGEPKSEPEPPGPRGGSTPADGPAGEDAARGDRQGAPEGGRERSARETRPESARPGREGTGGRAEEESEELNSDALGRGERPGDADGAEVGQRGAEGHPPQERGVPTAGGENPAASEGRDDGRKGGDRTIRDALRGWRGGERSGRPTGRIRRDPLVVATVMPKGNRRGQRTNVAFWEPSWLLKPHVQRRMRPLVRLAREALAAIVGGRSEIGPRWDAQKVATRTAGYLQPWRVDDRREEDGRPAVLVLPDVSGSMAGFASDVMEAAWLAGLQGVPGLDVAVVSHTNGYPAWVSVNGSAFVEAPEDAQTADYGAFEFYERIVKTFNVVAVVILADDDGAWLFKRLAGLSDIEHVYWLDVYCSSYGEPKVAEKFPPPWAEKYPGEKGPFSGRWFDGRWPPGAARKVSYAWRVSNAREALETLKKMTRR